MNSYLEKHTMTSTTINSIFEERHTHHSSNGVGKVQNAQLEKKIRVIRALTIKRQLLVFK